MQMTLTPNRAQRWFGGDTNCDEGTDQELDCQPSFFFPAFFAAAHRAFADAASFARRAFERRRFTFFTVFVTRGLSFLAC